MTENRPQIEGRKQKTKRKKKNKQTSVFSSKFHRTSKSKISLCVSSGLPCHTILEEKNLHFICHSHIALPVYRSTYQLILCGVTPALYKAVWVLSPGMSEIEFQQYTNIANQDVNKSHFLSPSHLCFLYQESPIRISTSHWTRCLDVL